MKIALITISFGEKYVNDSIRLIASIKRHLINCDVDVHLISDIEVSDAICHTSTKINVMPTYALQPNHIIKLTKFERVLQIKHALQIYDLIYLIDSDCLFVNNTTIEELIPQTTDHIVCVKHPWQTTGKNGWLVDKNKNTTAFMENTEIYIQSCFWGAYTHKFLQVVSDINEWIQIDIKNNVCAKWFEESHFNKYLLNQNKTILEGENYNFRACEYKSIIDKSNIKIIHFNAATKGHNF